MLNNTLLETPLVFNMCKSEDSFWFGRLLYRAGPGCQWGNSRGQIHGHLLEDERVSVSSLFAEVLRTDDTDCIPYSRLNLPCSLLISMFCYTSLFAQSCPSSSSILFASYPSAGRERGSLARGITRQTVRRFFSPASPDFEVLITSGVFTKVLKGNLYMVNSQAMWWSCSRGRWSEIRLVYWLKCLTLPCLE